MPFQYPAIINPGQITDTEINATAAITLTKLASGNTIYADTRCKVGVFTRDMTAASGTQAVTGTGFQPTHIQFIASGDSVAVAWFCVGYDDGTSKGVISSNMAVTGDTFTHDSTRSIFLITAAGDNYKGNVASFDSNGFTITWTKTGTATGTATITYMAYR